MDHTTVDDGEIDQAAELLAGVGRVPPFRGESRRIHRPGGVGIEHGDVVGERLWCAVDYDEELSKRAVIASGSAMSRSPIGTGKPSRRSSHD